MKCPDCGANVIQAIRADVCENECGWFEYYSDSRNDQSQ